jgi:prolyl-tRNA synthetase
MLQSQLFTKTRKEAPADEVAKNAQLLIRAGFVHKEMAGVYAYLPLGLRTLNRIVSIIREEMDGIGANELIMPALQDKTLWEKTDRWDDAKVDNWFKTKFASGGDTGLGITHEEPLTNLMRDHIASYRDLPVAAYQFQNKFRNEMRAKSGIMRGKEFMMKDLYSFTRSSEEHEVFYARAREAYIRIFHRLGIGDRTHVTFASGGIFSRFSEEFQTESEAGEDIIYIDTVSGRALNKEVLTDEVLSDLGILRENLVEKKSIEVGNIFTLGTKFSQPLGLTYRDEEGKDQLVVMGSYGIGPTRVMGTIAEIMGDERGLVWPKSIAPYRFHLVSLQPEDEAVASAGNLLYDALLDRGIEVLYDERKGVSPGEKFKDSDLIGIPTRIVVSKKTLESGRLEVKDRQSGEVVLLSHEELLSELPKM